eukprot:74355-Chlamydomonas_euryale.AAC.1
MCACSTSLPCGAPCRCLCSHRYCDAVQKERAHGPRIQFTCCGWSCVGGLSAGACVDVAAEVGRECGPVVFSDV